MLSPISMVRRVVRAAKRRIHEKLDPIGYARSIGVHIGERCILGASINFGTEPYLIRIGSHVRITSFVSFITHDGSVWVMRDEHPNVDLIGGITIGDNCYVGQNATIMPGVEIGSNCIIGACSLVTKSVPPNSVVAGIPAKFIKHTDEYLVGITDKTVPTKGLSADDTRLFIQQHPNKLLKKPSMRVS